MLLTDEEIAEISLSAVTVKDAIADVCAVEAAILAKLASAELPEPAGRVMEERNGFVRGRLYRIEDRVDGKPLYTVDQLRQAYAQGAAAQLDRLEKAEKDAERYRWLRSVGNKIESVTVTVWGDNGNPDSGHKHPEPEELDNKIDAAMEASK